MRRIPSSFDPTVVRSIDQRLDGVEQGLRVRIPLAIESGSRAWGFPSPDSDYDCRFLYVRRQEDYLSPWPHRDVVETPLDHVLDVNGWDLQKAVRLAVKGNAVVGEWLRSPMTYRSDPAFTAVMVDLLGRVADRAATGRHHLHVGRQQWVRAGAEADVVPLKKVLYALRPAAVLRWLRVRPNEAVPPMTLQELLAEGDVPGDLTRAVEELVELKAVTRELGAGPVPGVVRRFVLSELREEEWMHEGRERTALAAARADAAEVFRDCVARWGPC